MKDLSKERRLERLVSRAHDPKVKPENVAKRLGWMDRYRQRHPASFNENLKSFERIVRALEPNVSTFHPIERSRYYRFCARIAERLSAVEVESGTVENAASYLESARENLQLASKTQPNWPEKPLQHQAINEGLKSRVLAEYAILDYDFVLEPLTPGAQSFLRYVRETDAPSVAFDRALYHLDRAWWFLERAEPELPDIENWLVSHARIYASLTGEPLL